MQYDRDLLRRIHQLARENNQMLHSMQRRAFIGGIVRTIFWALLIGLPIWFYITFVHPTLSEMVEVFEQMQGAGNDLGARFSGFDELFERLGALLGSGTSTPEQ